MIFKRQIVSLKLGIISRLFDFLAAAVLTGNLNGIWICILMTF